MRLPGAESCPSAQAIAQATESVLGRDAFVSAADASLYEAKRSGRNRVCLHGSEKTPKPAEPRKGRDRSGPTGI